MGVADPKHLPGQVFTDLIVGISVGSEDLYRVTPTGIANQAGIGSSPDEIVRYIQQTRDKLDGHDDLKKKIGHVDTWTAWTNATNFPVTAAVDWIGMDGEESPIVSDTCSVHTSHTEQVKLTSNLGQATHISKPSTTTPSTTPETSSSTPTIPLWAFLRGNPSGSQRRVGLSLDPSRELRMPQSTMRKSIGMQWRVDSWEISIPGGSRWMTPRRIRMRFRLVC